MWLCDATQKSKIIKYFVLGLLLKNALVSRVFFLCNTFKQKNIITLVKDD